MSVALKSLAVLLTALGLAALSLWILAARQPSGAIHNHESVIFVAIKHDDASFVKSSGFLGEKALWRASAAFPFISDIEQYWTDYLILPDDPTHVTGIVPGGELADVYIAQVELTKIPSIVPGLLRAQHLVGLTRRPSGPLPTSTDVIEGRRDVLPTQASLDAALAMDSNTQVTMMNFLAYFPTPTGDKEPGRRTYRRYGQEAIKAVHMVGGQFLFSGTVTKVLQEAKGHPAPVVWDDLAAMIYPDPTAIFYMEQDAAYIKALGWRDDSLERTRVIATVSY